MAKNPSDAVVLKRFVSQFTLTAYPIDGQLWEVPGGYGHKIDKWADVMTIFDRDYERGEIMRGETWEGIKYECVEYTSKAPCP